MSEVSYKTLSKTRVLHRLSSELPTIIKELQQLNIEMNAKPQKARVGGEKRESYKEEIYQEESYKEEIY